MPEQSEISIVINARDEASAALASTGAAAREAGEDLQAAGAQAERLGASFQEMARQAGTSGDALLASLRATSAGTVADSDLMLSANRAMLLGLGGSAEQLGQLMEVARFRGRAMGLDTTQAFSDIVTGVGRASPMILDNLGIVLDSEAEYARWAEANGRAADALTETEKKQALLNAVLRVGQQQISDAGGVAADSADGYERLGAAAANLRDELAKATNEVLAPHVAKAAEGVDVYAEFLPEFERFVQLSSELAKQKVETTVGVNVDSEGFQYLATQAAKLIPGVGSVVGLAEGFGQVTTGVKMLTPELAKVNDELSKTDTVEEARLAGALAAQTASKKAANARTEAETKAASDSKKVLTQALADSDDIAQKMWKDRQDIAASYSKQVESLEKEHGKRLAELQEQAGELEVEAAKETAEALANLAKSRAREAEDLAIQSSRQVEDQARSDLRSTEDYNRQKVEAEASLNKSLSDMAEDYARSREDMLYAQAKEWSQAKNAAEYEEMREEQEREAEDRALRRAGEDEDFALSMAKMKENQEKRAASLKEQLAEENAGYAESRAALQASLSDEMTKFAEYGVEMEKLQDEATKKLTAADRLALEEHLTWITEEYMPQRAEALGLAVSGETEPEKLKAASSRNAMGTSSYTGQGASYSGGNIIVQGSIYGDSGVQRILNEALDKYNSQGGISWVGH